MDNAIALCFDCHADAGHYNPNHPRGTKFSPRELRRHRDAWWAVLQAEAAATASLRDGTEAMPPSAEFGMIEREVGTLWSALANEPECKEVVRFRGAEVGTYQQSLPYLSSHEWQLFLVRGNRYLVYDKHMHRGDWCKARLFGKWGEVNCPFTLTEVQSEYPELATAAGLEHVRVLEL